MFRLIFRDVGKPTDDNCQGVEALLRQFEAHGFPKLVAEASSLVLAFCLAKMSFAKGSIPIESVDPWVG